MAEQDTPYVYLNHAPVRDLPRGQELRIEEVLRRYGMDPTVCEVFRLQSESDPHGERVSVQDTVPLGEAVHYRAIPRHSPSPASSHVANPGSHLEGPQGRRESPMNSGRRADGPAEKDSGAAVHH